MKRYRVLHLLVLLGLVLSLAAFPASRVQADEGTINGIRDIPPTAFAKLSPANGATGQPFASLTLVWYGSSPVTHYEVCLADGVMSCETWLNVGNITTHTFTGLNPGTVYYWQVRAYNGVHMTEADDGAWWSFRTAIPALTRFSKRTPVNGTVYKDDSVTLTWEASAAATHYTVCLVPEGWVCSEWVNVGNTTSYTAANLVTNTRYNWQVRAYNGTRVLPADRGVWWNFFTKPIRPAAFNKLAPESGSTNVSGASLTLSWQASDNAQYYAVCVAATSYTCETWLNAGENTSITVTNLRPGTRYNWQVRAYNSTLMTPADASRWWSFTTAP